MSLGNFCNGRYIIILIQENINVTKPQKVIICVHRNHGTGLWDIPFELTTPKIKIKIYIKDTYVQQPARNFKNPGLVNF